MKTGLESVYRTASFLAALAAASATGHRLVAQVKENLDLPFDAIGEDEEEEDAPDVVSFYTLNLEGDGFFYVIDKSGSMNDVALPAAKQEVIKNIREFSDRVFFGVVFFDKDIEQFPANGGAAPADAASKQSGISFVSTAAGGARGSCCKEGILAALRMANLAPPKRNVLTYLGDGGGQCAGYPNVTEYYQSALSAVKAANYRCVKINAIGVLQVYTEGEVFLRQLAAQNGGTYTRI